MNGHFIEVDGNSILYVPKNVVVIESDGHYEIVDSRDALDVFDWVWDGGHVYFGRDGIVSQRRMRCSTFTVRNPVFLDAYLTHTARGNAVFAREWAIDYHRSVSDDFNVLDSYSDCGCDWGT